jgi:starch synthase
MTEQDVSGRPLRILIMAAEMVPYVKTGQVADVIASLAAALRRLGHDARVALPRYSHIDIERAGLRRIIEGLQVPMDPRALHGDVYIGTAPSGVPVYFIDNPRYFGQESLSTYIEDAEPFVFYCRATTEMLKRPEIDWQPDLVHCHDWQTALVPNWLATIYGDDPSLEQVASVFTIHRLSHQGIFGYRVLEAAGLEEYGYLTHAAISDLDEMVDLLARGIYYADAITTVSETYAREIQTPEYGERLDPLLRDLSGRLFGILNGIDDEAYNPADDGRITARFDADSLEARAANKTALQRMLGLAVAPDAPLIGMVSRLTDIKGFDLLTDMLDVAMENLNIQLAILGVGDPRYHELLGDYARRYPGRIGLQLTFNDAIERHIYAGSDMFLMPSRVEPCGLGHMLAMRYGSVPIVHATGGLADTVTDFDPTGGTGHGFSFVRYDAMALYTTLVRAVEAYRYRSAWQELQRRCMSRDFSWGTSAAKYVEVYRWALDRHLHHERPSFE